MSSGIKVKDEVIDPEYEEIASGEIQVKNEPQDFPEGFFDSFENNKFLDELVGTLAPELDGDNEASPPPPPPEPADDILSSTNPPPPEPSAAIEKLAPATNASNTIRQKKSPIRAPAASDTDESEFLLESEEAAIQTEIENLTRTIERRKATLLAANIKREKISPSREEARNRSPSPFTRRIKRERITPPPEPRQSTSRQRSHTERHSPSPVRRSRSPRRRLSRSPASSSRRRSRSPEYRRSPRRRSSRSPRRSSSRRRSRSPVGLSSSRRRSRSPEKRRSPMRRKSRSPPPRWGRSRSPPILRRRSSSRERAIRSDMEFQKERQRLLELIQAKKAADSLVTEGGLEDMELETPNIVNTTNSERTTSVPSEPVTLRVMPKPVIIKTEPIDPVEVVMEMPPAKRIKTEEIEEVPLSHRDRALKFCTDTLKNFNLFQRSIRKKQRFLYTPTLLVRKTVDAESLQENRSPLNHGITVQYPFNSVRMNVDTEKFGICKVGEQTAKIVNLLGYNANEFLDRLNPNAKLNRDVPDELISAESAFFVDAETQTSADPCRQCLKRQLTKRYDKGVQISMQPIGSSSTSSVAAKSDPMYDFVSHLLPAQCTAIKEFVRLLEGPAPSSIEDRAKVRETLIDIFTVAQSQSNKQPFEQPPSATILTASNRYNQSTSSSALQIQNQNQTNSMYGSSPPLSVPAPYHQPQPVPAPYQQAQSVPAPYQQAQSVPAPYQQHIPPQQPINRMMHTQQHNSVYQQPNNMMQQQQQPSRYYPPPINHVPQSHVRPPQSMHGGLPPMQSNYHHMQPTGVVPQMRSRFPPARPMRADDPRTSRYTNNIELGPPPPPPKY